MKLLSGILVGAVAVTALTACSATETPSDPGSAHAEGCSAIDLASPPESPTNIRFGHGSAAEEPFWLMVADGSTNQYENSWYTMEMFPFRGTGERLVAYQAGDLDAVIITPQAQITGTARGALNLYTIGTVMREAEPGFFSTAAVVREDSGIDSIADLKGATIAILDEGAQPDFIARQALESVGLDPVRDANFVVLPYPSQEEALRAGQIDVAIIPEPFYGIALNNGAKHLFDASDITDFAYDLLTLSFDKDFVEANLGAVCAWAADFAAASDAYAAEPLEGKKTIYANSDFVTIPEPIYLNTLDYSRPAGGVVDPAGTERMIDAMVEFGILEERDRIDVSTLIREGVTLGN